MTSNLNHISAELQPDKNPAQNPTNNEIPNLKKRFWKNIFYLLSAGLLGFGAGHGGSLAHDYQLKKMGDYYYGILVERSKESSSELLKKHGIKLQNLQLFLKQLNHFSGDANGKFEENTYVAIKKYQEEKGLEIDGVICENTLKSLITDGLCEKGFCKSSK